MHPACITIAALPLGGHVLRRGCAHKRVLLVQGRFLVPGAVPPNPE